MLDVPKGVVTETWRTPAPAPVLMLIVEVTWVELATILLTVIPADGLKFTDDVCDRFVPKIVIVNVAPRTCLRGDMLLMVGAGEEELIPNTKKLVEVPPLAVVTVTNRPPVAALAPMLTEQVAWPAVELMLVMVTSSGGLKLTDVAPARLAPLIVRVNDEP